MVQRQRFLHRQKLAGLMEMGFKQSDACKALKDAQGDLRYATHLLLTYNRQEDAAQAGEGVAPLRPFLVGDPRNGQYAMFL